MPTATRSTPFQRLYRVFRLLHQRNRYVGEEPTTGLNLLEAHLLTELDAAPNMTQTELLVLLGVDQSTLSRTAKRLERAHLIVLKVDPMDARKRRLSLTEKGRRVVHKSDQVTDETFDELSAGLSSSEAASIGKLYQSIADGFGHPNVPMRQGETSYRLHQRRITRCFGLISDDVWGTGRSGTQWQVITELASSASPYRTIPLANKLGLSGSALWSQLNALEEEGLAVRSVDEDDRRSVLVEATDSGREISFAIEEAAAGLLARALSDVSSRNIEAWTATLETFAKFRGPSECLELPGGRYQVAIRPSERADARAFLIYALAGSKTAHLAPETLAGSHELIVKIVRLDETVAVLCGSKLDAAWTIAITASTAPMSLEALKKAIRGSLLEYVHEQAGVEAIELSNAAFVESSSRAARGRKK